MKKLTVREEGFVQALFKKNSASDAYRANYSVDNMKPTTVNKRASELKNTEHIQARIKEMQTSVANATIIDVAGVLQMWNDIATADANDIMKMVRRCCRHCHGKAYKYQWRNKEEFADAIARAVTANSTRRGKNKTEMPSDAGGYGYNFKEEPHPDCPECGGEGRPEIFIADTSKLTGAAKRLYGGVEYTKNGPRIKLRNQDDAAKNLAASLGMFKEIIELTGKDGTPLVMPTDPVEAAKFYSEFMKSGIKR